ncbi:hypothetical protein SAMN05661080_05158 [Modestobacter sp. DSM 44400]|uniref:hypothetical protein n=1 Tax=Modestobacter sp. DSM 44400 TaxID=1550230 RepID=UPI00089516DE|nr:hypothetical protein [Modestobacter sp. DSM 44400]SDY96742.1 hypothetical protein SAMN05661080_05158 [Modestobacter sp. DSM 44400]
MTEPETPAPADGNAEAARYRVRAREAEQQRDVLAARVERLQRSVIESKAGRLAHPADLFDVGGHSVADFLDANGEVGDDRLTDAVTALITARPRLSRWQQEAEAMAPGAPSGGSRSSSAPSWSDVVRGAT